jgi:hydroxymethylglutaryl-CoA synthase
MRGIVAWGTYLPFWRLDRSSIAAVAGPITGGPSGGRGTRTVASYDEDPTTMAVEAARRALRTTGAVPDVALLATVSPAYADRTNATALHAALRLPDTTAAFDAGLSPRSAMGALLLGLRSTGTSLIAGADIRGGLAGSADEANGGDAAAAFVIADDGPDAPVVAEVVAVASRTAEFIDRWRSPGETRSKTWDDKFAEVTYAQLGADAWSAVLDAAGVSADEIAAVAVAGPTTRIANTVAVKLGPSVVDDLAANVGNTGAAQPGMLLAALLEQARLDHREPGRLVALVSLADGADIVLLRTRAALSTYRPAPTIGAQIDGGAPVAYGRYLAWRGTLGVEPPRRPEPARVSATAAARSADWKFGFVGSRDVESGAVNLPPAADATGTEPVAMADATGTIATFTVDRVAYSPSPPVVFAVVDFDGGGRLPIELTDCSAADVESGAVAIGARVELTFRRLGATDGIVNYFWKGRLVRGE